MFSYFTHAIGISGSCLLFLIPRLTSHTFLLLPFCEGLHGFHRKPRNEPKNKPCDEPRNQVTDPVSLRWKTLKKAQWFHLMYDVD